MGREKPPMTEEQYEKSKVKLFAKASKRVKAFANELADYCWSLDQWAVVQDWEADKEFAIAFGVPPEIRKMSNAKNYFTRLKVQDSGDGHLKCHVCFPIDGDRPDRLRKHDIKKRLCINSTNQCEGCSNQMKWTTSKDS